MTENMTDTQLVEKRSGDIDIKSNNSHEHQCVELIKGLYGGKFWLMPTFAQELVSYLYEDMPNTDNPRVAANHLATRGMFVLQKAYQLSEDSETLKIHQNNDDDKKNEDDTKEALPQVENKTSQVSYSSIARESSLLIAGCLYGRQQYFVFLVLFASISMIHPLYNSFSAKVKKYLTCIYVCLLAYTIM
tara:strand:- start:4997 stop:5563 length:567 start_codon:yes stop_codon:yes gene_type:complete